MPGRRIQVSSGGVGTGGAGGQPDRQFVMLRTGIRENIFRYIRRKPSSAEWQRRLPELAKRLEEILYRKYPNKYDYYNMTVAPVEPELQFAIRTLIAQNEQNRRNRQLERQTPPSSSSNLDMNHGVPSEQFASPQADMQNNNDDGHNRTEMEECSTLSFSADPVSHASSLLRNRTTHHGPTRHGSLSASCSSASPPFPHPRPEITPTFSFSPLAAVVSVTRLSLSSMPGQVNQVGSSGVTTGGANGQPRHQPEPVEDTTGLTAPLTDQQFVMLRTAMREKIFEYIGRRQSSAEWRRRLPELAKRLEDILYTKFPNRNDYYNMMKGPVEPQLQSAIRALAAQYRQNQLNPQVERQTPPSSSSNLDMNHDVSSEQFASPQADMQNNNADEHSRTE